MLVYKNTTPVRCAKTHAEPKPNAAETKEHSSNQQVMLTKSGPRAPDEPKAGVPRTEQAETDRRQNPKIPRAAQLRARDGAGSEKPTVRSVQHARATV